jgi:hypothetical protein
MLGLWRRLVLRLSSTPVVSIAKIRGRTRGIGNEFVLACDMRFASRQSALATRVGAFDPVVFPLEGDALVTINPKEDRLERLVPSSFDHLLPAQGRSKPGRGSPSCRGTLAAGSAFAMLVDVWRARSLNPWWRAWDCPGNKVRSQWEQSAGSLPEPLPKSRGGCERGSTFGPCQGGAGHGATAVGECRTSA